MDTTAPRTPKVRDRTWAGLLVLALLVAAAAGSLRLADRTKPADWLGDQLTYVPSGRILKPMVLDYDEAVASLLWVRGMVYFADAYLNGRSYRWLGHILDVVTQLNPRLVQAYEFAGVVLTKEKRELPKTLRILERGVEAFPDNWRLRLYASMAHVAHDSDYVKAAGLLEPVTLQADVPAHIRTMAASLLQKGGGPRMALAFLVDRAVRSDNPIQREIFVEKILKVFPRAEGSPPDKVRKRVIEKALHEARVEPIAEYMAVDLLQEYLSGGPISDKNRKLLSLLGE